MLFRSHNKLWKILKEMGISDHLTCLLRNLYQVRKQQLETDKEQKTGSRRNINDLRNADDTTLMAESKEELKSLLMKVKEESEKPGLKLNIQKAKITASGPTASLHIVGETMKTVTDIILRGSKITADGDFSSEIKRHLLLGRKVMTNLESTLPTKVRLVKAMFFQ